MLITVLSRQRKNLTSVPAYLSGEETRAHELTCDEFLEVMGQVAELQQQGLALPAELTHALEHLAICAGCEEELKAVRAALAAP